MKRLIDFLLENAGASIKYRVKKEILNIPVECDEMQALQSEILNLSRVKKAFAIQREDGFIGSVIHGAYFDGFDSTVAFEFYEPTMERLSDYLGLFCELFPPKKQSK